MLKAVSDTEPFEPAACSLDDVADHVMAARRVAVQLGDEFLTYLLDMSLVEIASRGKVRPS